MSINIEQLEVGKLYKAIDIIHSCSDLTLNYTIIIFQLNYNKNPFMFLDKELLIDDDGCYLKILVFDKIGWIYVFPDELFEELK